MSARPGPTGRGIGDDPARERLAAATVALMGSEGYASTTVEAICERARVAMHHFDRCFAGKEDCFLEVHGEIAAELCAIALDAYQRPLSWHDRVWAAGWAAMRYMREDAVRARFLVIAASGAGARAQARRDRVLQGLADLIDAGRAELEDPDSISRCTAEIVAGSVYETILARVRSAALERNEDFLPELVYMITLPYLGASAAEDELLVQSLR